MLYPRILEAAFEEAHPDDRDRTLALWGGTARAGLGLDAGPVWVSEADFIHGSSRTLLGQASLRIGAFGKSDGYGAYLDLAYMLGAARTIVAVQRNFGSGHDWRPFVTVDGRLFAAIDYPIAFTAGAGVGMAYRMARVELRVNYVGSPSQGRYGPLSLVEAKVGMDLLGRPR